MMRMTLLAAAMSLAMAAQLQAQSIAITGARIHTVSGGVIENGTVVVRDGRITAVGANVAIPPDARRVDGAGRVVTPGFIHSGTELGIVEIGLSGPPTDQRARGRDQVAASFTVWDGLNPASVLIPPTRADGITSVVIAPSGGLISGQAALVDLVGVSVTEMVRRAPVAMVAQVAQSGAAGVGARGELIGRLREIFTDARDYGRRRAAFESNQTREFAASRADLEALQPVLRGTLPLVVVADRASDIEAALRIAQEFGIRLMIAGGAEAWLVADQLARTRTPVLTGAMNNIPTGFSALGQRQENPAILERAGVRVAIVGNSGNGDEELFNIRNVRYSAGNGVAYGMSYDAALRAVTLTPAELFGVSDRIGSIEVGKDANLVLWSGDPFEFATRAELVLVRGQDVTGPTRQDLLTERYRTLPPRYTP
jgi:imidazolonepropionase-like amidohydrolase